MTRDSSFSQSQIEQLDAMEKFHFWTRARRSLILEHLESFAPGRRILDVGCGTGSLVSELVQRGYDAVGIDPQKEGLLKRKEQEPFLSLICASAEILPFADGQFDAVVLADVLEHISEEKPLREIFRVLVSGGILILTVPAFPWAWSQRDQKAGHLRRYFPSHIRSLALQVCGKIVYLGYYQFFLFPLFLISRFLNVDPKKEVAIPSWVNRICLAMNSMEVRLGKWIRWPWGSSIVAVIKKK